MLSIISFPRTGAIDLYLLHAVSSMIHLRSSEGHGRFVAFFAVMLERPTTQLGHDINYMALSGALAVRFDSIHIPPLFFFFFYEYRL